MRLPKRKSQTLLRREDEEGGYFLTPKAVCRLQEELERLEREERPKIVEELSRAIQLGDLSENAEYQDARHRLSRLDGRLFSLREKAKRAIVIQGGGSDRVVLGSTVVVKTGGKSRTYQIIGPHETNPARGRISHLSPLGSTLIGHAAGEIVKVKIEDREIEYRIIEVK